GAKGQRLAVRREGDFAVKRWQLEPVTRANNVPRARRPDLTERRGFMHGVSSLACSGATAVDGRAGAGADDAGEAATDMYAAATTHQRRLRVAAGAKAIRLRNPMAK